LKADIGDVAGEYRDNNRFSIVIVITTAPTPHLTIRQCILVGNAVAARRGHWPPLTLHQR